jgi:hypothetical protein
LGLSRRHLTRVLSLHIVLFMFLSTHQIWNEAVSRNTAALKAVVAELVGLLAVYGGVDAVKVPRVVHSTLLRVLRPMESALRRLIVIAARDLVVEPAKPSSPHLSPKRSRTRGNGSRHVAFQLFDPRKRFLQRRVTYTSLTPRIFFIAPDPPFNPLVQRFEPTPDVEPEVQIGALRICLRLKAVASALDDLPRQALRLARLKVRREKRNSFIPPLRPGRPPGYRQTRHFDIDLILDECHRFAQGVLSETKPDTS